MSGTGSSIGASQVATLERRIRQCPSLQELKAIGHEIRALSDGASWEVRRGDREAVAVWRAAYTVRRAQLKQLREGSTHG
jgi:hypothetical protein